jgi:diguanylate cyclase (GGDEF)-like protein/PAS domain S-box-containing protein
MLKPFPLTDIDAPRAPLPGSLAASIPGVLWEADGTTFHTTCVSPQALDLLGLDPAAWMADPGFWSGHVHPDDLESVLAATRAATLSGAPCHMEYRFRTGDGTYCSVQDTVRLVRDEREPRLVGVMVRLDPGPVPARAAGAVPQAVPAADFELHQILDNLADGVYYVDPHRRITYWNRGAERLTGYRTAEVVGRACYDNLLAHIDAEGTELCFTACPLSASIADGKPRDAQVWLRHADGSRRAVQVRTAPVRDAAGITIGGVEVFSDATGLVEAKDAAEAARRDAFTDPLTGLPNRRLLDAVLAQRKDDLDRHGQSFGLMIADIDNFKHFNDGYGHEVGDQALLVVASTLRSAVRAGDAVTRWGGEEFAIVGAQVDADGLARLGERVLTLVRAARVPGPHGPLKVRISVGAALALPGESLADLFGRADRAMFDAKAGGRDRCVLSTPQASEPRLARATAPRAHPRAASRAKLARQRS